MNGSRSSSPMSGEQYTALPPNSASSSNSNNDDRRWSILLFSLTTILLFADQNLMSPNLTAIAQEFDFTDEERDVKLGGHIALAFWMLGAPAGILIGILADQINRIKLFAWTIGIGEGACLVTFWTRTYGGLFVCRALTGLSMGGALPLIYSIMGDTFKADERHKVNSFVGMGTGWGVSMGQAIAGFLGPTFGWRLPFLVVSIPALLCAAVVLATVEDPERGGMEEAILERKNYEAGAMSTARVNLDVGASMELEMQRLTTFETADEVSATRNNHGPSSIVRRRSKEFISDGKKSAGPDSSDLAIPISFKSKNNIARLLWRHIDLTIQSMKTLFRTPTVLFALLQGFPGSLPWGVVNTYLNDFLAEDRSMSVEYATFVLMLFGGGNFCGMVLAGAGGQFLYRVDKRYPALLAGSTSILACVPFWVLLNGVDGNSNFVYLALVSWFAGAASGVTGPIIKATLLNVTPPTMRGQAFALFNTSDDFGKGIGPVFIAQLITSMGGRTHAFNFATLGWALCGVFNLACFFTCARDEAKVQETIAAGFD